MSWARRLLNTFRAGRTDRDITRELSFHVSERIDQLRAEGVPLEEAHLAAQRQLGNSLRLRKEAYHMNSIGWLEQLLQDVRLTSRMLRRSPAFAVAAISTLAIGIGATAAVFSVVNAVLIRPLPYPDPDRLIGVFHSAQFQQTTSNNIRLTSTMYLTYREHNQAFAEFGVWRPQTAAVTGQGDPEEVRAVVLTYGALAALGVRPTFGRWFSEADDTPGTPDTAIVSYGYWQRRLAGSPAAVGQHITIDGRSHAIIGVMPRGFRFLHADPDVILPQRFQGAQLVPNDVHMYMGIARLKPGLSVEQASNDVRRMLPIWIQERGTNAAALTAARFGPALRSAKEEVVGDIGGMLWLLMGTIAVVLLIACANVANLLLVRAEGRRQELTVRAALGAGWKQLARQLLAESVTLAILGGIAGLALAYGGLQLLVAIAPASLPRLSEISIDPVVLLFTVGVSVSSALVFGLIPIAKYSGPRTWMALSGVARGRVVGHTRERHRTQNALVVLQVALAVVLLVASGLMIRSFQALRDVHPGFAEPEQIQTIRLSIPATQVPEPERVVQMQHEIADRLASIPGVTAAAYAAALPMEMEFENNAATSVEGRTYEGIPPLVRAKNVSPGLFKTLGTPMIAGRDLTWTDIHERRLVAIVSNTMARDSWGEPSAAIGRRLRMGRVGPWSEVVGVVGDIHDSGVHQAAPPIVYWPASVFLARDPRLPAFVLRDLTFAVRNARTGSDDFVRDIARAVWSVNPNLPLGRVQTLGEVYERSMARTSFTLVMLAIAGAMALALGIVGIYGVIAYAVSQRRGEIGLRLALGAARGRILRQFLGQGVRVTGVACLAGLALSVLVTRLLSRMLYGISPTDPATLSGAAVLVLVVASLATLVPAVRAAFVEPMHVLREE
jgi:putative ABC transport system permease protein